MITLAFQESLVPGESLACKLHWLADNLIEGIELDGRQLAQRIPEIQRELSRFPVKVTAICGGYRGWLIGEDSEEQRHFLSDMRTLLESAARLGACGVIAPAIWGTSRYLPLPARTSSLEEDRERLIEHLRILGEYAHSLGTAVLLEPLNRYQAHYINQITEALDIIETVESPGVRLIADLFHMNVEEANPLASLAVAGSHLSYVHLSDSNRRLPGLGHIDFGAVFRELERIGFQGPASVEALPAESGDELVACARFLNTLQHQTQKDGE
ncbi:MAG TPA: sugar phosphate isomerase/epimerase [Firmicutes bacterium]|nr:sugar phosphate isomerase/epimerase [Bacillota bacterium]